MTKQISIHEIYNRALGAQDLGKFDVFVGQIEQLGEVREEWVQPLETHRMNLVEVQVFDNVGRGMMYEHE